jgi:hypothetical protein
MKALDCEPDDVFKPQLFTPEEVLSHWIVPPLADVIRLAGRALPPAARGALGGWSFVAAPMQIHAAVLAVFASFVAPFGEGGGVGGALGPGARAARLGARAGPRRAPVARARGAPAPGRRARSARPGPCGAGASRQPPPPPRPSPPHPPPSKPGGFFASGFKRAFKMKDFGDTIPGHGGVTDRFDCQMIMAMFAYLYYWTFVARTERSVGEWSLTGRVALFVAGVQRVPPPRTGGEGGVLGGGDCQPLSSQGQRARSQRLAGSLPPRPPGNRSAQPSPDPTPTRPSDPPPRRRPRDGAAPGAGAAAGAVRAARQHAARPGPAAGGRGEGRAVADASHQHHSVHAAVARPRAAPRQPPRGRARPAARPHCGAGAGECGPRCGAARLRSGQPALAASPPPPRERHPHSHPQRPGRFPPASPTDPYLPAPAPRTHP